MDLGWYDFVGVMGVACVLAAYYLLQIGKVMSDNLLYSLANLLGSLLIVVSLFYKFNFASLVIQIFWILISGIGIGRYFRLRAGRRPAD